MNNVLVKIDGVPRLELEVEQEPTNEMGLNCYKEYIDLCYEVGLGAPVEVEVTTKGWFSSKKYSFSYTMKGNSVRYNELLKKIRGNLSTAICEEMRQDAENGRVTMAYSYKVELLAKLLCREVDRICNVGSYMFRDEETGRFIVVIDFFPVYERV